VETLKPTEHTMSNTALNSNAFNTLPRAVAPKAMNEFIAAMPVAIFAKAMMAAFQGPAASRVAARRAASN
jgi:hypothetical protein